MMQEMERKTQSTPEMKRGESKLTSSETADVELVTARPKITSKP